MKTAQSKRLGCFRLFAIVLVLLLIRTVEVRMNHGSIIADDGDLSVMVVEDDQSGGRVHLAAAMACFLFGVIICFHFNLIVPFIHVVGQARLPFLSPLYHGI